MSAVDEAVRRAAAILQDATECYIILAQEGVNTVKDIEGNGGWVRGALETARDEVVEALKKARNS
jgi:hypothetical protein